MSRRIALLITTRNSRGDYQELRAGLNDLETVFKVLNEWVRNGVELIDVHYSGANELVALPVEAFDGEYIDESLAALRLVWEAILEKHSQTNSPVGDHVAPGNPNAFRHPSEAYPYTEPSDDSKTLTEQANELLTQSQHLVEESRMHRKEARAMRRVLHQKIEDSIQGRLFLPLFP